MRRRLYGSLGVLAAVTALAILVTEATKGQCTIVCTWQIPFLMIGVGASVAFLVLAVWAIVFELGHAAIGSRNR